jgi:cytochrome c biogenesis factor
MDQKPQRHRRFNPWTMLLVITAVSLVILAFKFAASR